MVALNIVGTEDDDEYVEAELTEKELQLLAIKNGIAERVSGLREHANSCNKAVADFRSELSERNATNSATLQRLQEELRELSQKNNMDETPHELNLEELLKDTAFKESYDRTQQHNENLANKKHERKSSGVKRLFKLIAMKTHPDKTKKSWLHDLFNLARKAYDDNDMQRLEKIFKCIVTKTTWAFLRLEEEVEELQIQEALTSQEVNQIVNSAMFQAMTDYRSGVPHLMQKAANYFNANLQSEIDKVFARLHCFDPGKYPIVEIEDEKFFIKMFSSTTSWK